ncbi:hypothetical protein ACIOWI_27490 [Streptomyces sp. NPDC087659]|uniref:hypothetical protein n=1 Tax=Streptomyces sp. NPDC087659 TaxID=3365801 RepID=UPI00382C328D
MNTLAETQPGRDEQPAHEGRSGRAVREVRTCRRAIVESGSPEARKRAEADPEWNIFRGED